MKREFETDMKIVFKLKKGAVLECTGCPDSSEAEYQIKGVGGFFCEKCKEKYIKGLIWCSSKINRYVLYA